MTNFFLAKEMDVCGLRESGKGMSVIITTLIIDI